MRTEFSNAMVEAHSKDPRLMLLTGDLGYLALEPVQRALKEQFVNTGVAEQNMICVAAGLARQGFIPWAYSIAPFLVCRAFEQIRNDLGFHNANVKLAGNGGGYGYGIMGATHHALEDIALMRLVSNMRVYVPLYAADVQEAVSQMMMETNPGYLRLGLGIRQAENRQPFSCWRKLTSGIAATVVGVGPVLQSVLELANGPFAGQLSVWAVSRFPMDPLPNELAVEMRKCGRLVTIEEHRQPGGIGEMLAAEILSSVHPAPRLLSLFARGYPSGRHGAQTWHQMENQLAGPSLAAALEGFLHA